MTKLLPSRSKDRAFQGGFSLIELMIAITLGLMIMSGLVTIFVKNSQARSEIERSNRQLESGRYAMSLLTEDLRMAGFLSSFDPLAQIIHLKGSNDAWPPLGPDTANGLPAITDITTVDPCAASAEDLRRSFFFHVQGYDNAATIPSCVSDVRAGSDILVIRRASSCVAGPVPEAGCDALPAGTPFFQHSGCYRAAELFDPLGLPDDYKKHFILDTNAAILADPAQTKHALNCTTVANWRRYLTHIYFVANNNAAGDGIPTLKRAELRAGGFTIVPLVEGIETVQFEYGVDTSDPTDGVIEGYTTDPSTYNGCADAACVFNWLRTYSVKVNLLARNVEPSPGWRDNKTYTLGLKKDGTANVFPATGTYGDAYKRHAYNATVRLDNPQGRAQP